MPLLLLASVGCWFRHIRPAELRNHPLRMRRARIGSRSVQTGQLPLLIFEGLCRVADLRHSGSRSDQRSRCATISASSVEEANFRIGVVAAINEAKCPDAIALETRDSTCHPAPKSQAGGVR
jgi:hypothetical protein